MLLQEATSLLKLHAQAVVVSNIRSLVPIVLGVDSGNFNHWRDQFLLTLGKFSLQNHIHLDTPVLSPDWTRMDCVLKSWILGTLADDLAEEFSSQGSTAREAWLTVESQILGNREARTIQLETKFRRFVQGDLSITEYCRHLNKMADDLGALGEIITERTLVLNVIRGLIERFAHVRALLRRSRPFPSFLEACDDLILEELTLEDRQPSPTTALAASTKSSALQQVGTSPGDAGGAGTRGAGTSPKAATTAIASVAATLVAVAVVVALGEETSARSPAPSSSRLAAPSLHPAPRATRPLGPHGPPSKTPG